MSLQLKFSTCVKNNGCSTIIFNEETGIYDATLNTGGWGTPNIDISNVVETHLYITLPDGTVVDILDPVGLPTNNTSLEYEINATTLDVDFIEDGLYIFEYTVTDSTTTYTSGTKYFLFTCNLECCVNKMFLKIASMEDCECNSLIIKNALYASALLEGLKANANCGNKTSLTKIINKLNKICGFTTNNCGCF